MGELEAELRRLEAMYAEQAGNSGHPGWHIGKSEGFKEAADLARDHEAAKREGGWREISSAPRNGTWVLLYELGHGICLGFADGEPWKADDKLCDPTHWRPLPEPPVAEGE